MTLLFPVFRVIFASTMFEVITIRRRMQKARKAGTLGFVHWGCCPRDKVENGTGDNSNEQGQSVVASLGMTLS